MNEPKTWYVILTWRPHVDPSRCTPEVHGSQVYDDEAEAARWCSQFNAARGSGVHSRSTRYTVAPLTIANPPRVSFAA